jgi:hypothetical protein
VAGQKREARLRDENVPANAFGRTQEAHLSNVSDEPSRQNKV